MTCIYCGAEMTECVVMLAGESVGRHALMCHQCTASGKGATAVSEYTAVGTGQKAVEQARFADKSVD